MAPIWRIRQVGEGEFEPWSTLFRGYCAFYDWPTSDEHQSQIWQWIHVEKTV